MTKAYILDGKAIADEVLARVAAETAALAARGVTPGLATVLVGEDPASQTYVASKGKAAKSCGFHSVQLTLPGDDQRSRTAGAGREAQRRPGGSRHPRPASAAEGDRRAAGAGGDRPEKGRRRLPSDQCRPALDRRDGARARAVHAGRRDDHARQGRVGARRDARRPGGRGDRPLQHRRQADGATPASAATAR